MDGTPAPRTPALRRLYWRSEILQVMYWLHGEGFGDVVTAQGLSRFIDVDPQEAGERLEELIVDGYLLPVGDAVTLSEEGLREGAQEFASAFAELTKPSHGECSEDCWCHASAEEAAACFDARHQRSN